MRPDPASAGLQGEELLGRDGEQLGPALFEGTYRSPTIQDFICERVVLYPEKESAVQVGGDIIGRSRAVTLACALKSASLMLVSLSISAWPFEQAHMNRQLDGGIDAHLMSSRERQRRPHCAVLVTGRDLAPG